MTEGGSTVEGERGSPVAHLPVRPVERCWFVTPTLMGGAYPGSREEEVARAQLHALLGSGVSLFLDLTTEHDGMVPYEPLIADVAGHVPARERPRRVSLPVLDMTAAPVEVVLEALSVIDAELGAGGRVYVHCWGGKGRTGTILGCWLARELGGEEALRRLNELRDAQVTHVRDTGRPVPETRAQRQLVTSWPRSELRG